ncbi:hypothetical protein LTR10_016801 [Elasticomyces elasticus]|uniref:Uncharacterized protein n=1 Tax=Exophiala sideris TaxID=1016849 RepID=A0ABR0JMU3_9EURO|nr:hypothetical protein LTR10_016801 [Elasticomyces elasticus]KAK5037804.1 hypothetical protein LTS07_001271 [Exophiala sideris]KAK5043787.1 hypothetical protein LTR13_000141 [Exophiala sideris]KAK5067286.1 hypothetical protein LTR69_001273 [Exophiala sideris]KAK5182619.1 hypothetical protein LTR44_005010 [Eurotiomycetes sp. CCFEE 6388]
MPRMYKSEDDPMSHLGYNGRMTDQTSILRQTALTFISAFETLSTETFASLQAPSYIHTFAPASCNPPAALDGAHFIQHLSSMRDIMRGFPVRPKEVFVNEGLNQVTVYADSETWFHEDVKDDSVPADEWLYHGEYIFILDMDDSQTKIKRVFEFLDSKGTEQLRVLLSKARQNRAASQAGGSLESGQKPAPRWQ